MTSSDAIDEEVVARIVLECSCTKRHAIAALKVHRNDADGAIASISRSRLRHASRTLSIRPATRPVSQELDQSEKIPSDSDGDANEADEQTAESNEETTAGPSDRHSRQARGKRVVVNDEKEISTQPRHPIDDGKQTLEQEHSDTVNHFVPAAVTHHVDLEVVTPEISNRQQLEEFRIPMIQFSLPPKLFNAFEGRRGHFSMVRLLWAIQNGLSSDGVRKYLSYFESAIIASGMSQLVLGYPPIFFAVAANNEAVVRIFVDYGGNINSVEPATGLPLLVFAIINSKTTESDTTALVRAMLMMGVDVSVIPQGIFQPTARDAPQTVPENMPDPSIIPANQRWCNAFFQKRLKDSINVSQMYFLRRRSRTSDPTPRLLQFASEHKVSSLFNLPFTMVGQDTGIQLLTDRLLTCLMMPSNKPLVLMFAGPSGHGKTELGRRLGELLSLNTTTVDMTHMRHETDLFGPHAPYVGYENGAPLNNFLANNDGKRAIVMLDEVEKAACGIIDSVLIIFDEGKYQDRRSRTHLDCTKIIWILTTNAMDPIIKDFSQSNEVQNRAAQKLDSTTAQKLQSRLMNSSKAIFGHPFSGRISAVIPFLPFFIDEQAVIVHKYLLELKSRLRQPITLPAKQFIGNVDLQIAHESDVCYKLAEDYYDPDRGARSLETAVRNEIEPLIVGKYVEQHERIVENQPIERYCLDLDATGELTITRDSEAT